MKLKIHFGKAKLALLGVVVFLALAAVVLNILFLSGVGKLVTNVPIAAGISLAFSILILAFVATIFFNSNYQFGDDAMTSNISFFKDRIAYDTITDIKENSDSKALFIVFKYKNEKVANRLSAIRILVKAEDNQKVVAFLKEKNTSIIFSNFVDGDNDKISHFESSEDTKVETATESKKVASKPAIKIEEKASEAKPATTKTEAEVKTAPATKTAVAKPATAKPATIKPETAKPATAKPTTAKPAVKKETPTKPEVKK